MSPVLHLPGPRHLQVGVMHAWCLARVLLEGMSGTPWGRVGIAPCRLGMWLTMTKTLGVVRGQLARHSPCPRCVRGAVGVSP